MRYTNVELLAFWQQESALNSVRFFPAVFLGADGFGTQYLSLALRQERVDLRLWQQEPDSSNARFLPGILSDSGGRGIYGSALIG
jgi:hypothetical protein